MKTTRIRTPQNWQGLEPHPLSALVEFGAGIEIEALAAHMRSHGYDRDEAIILHDGMILDGRHKHAAAIKAGIIPTFRKFAGVNPMAYVCKKIFRQHLTPSQLAMMGATLAKVIPIGMVGNPANLPDQPPTQSLIAKTLNISERSVRDAVKVQNAGTASLQNAVMDGTIAVSNAAKLAREPAEIQDQAVDNGKVGKAITGPEAAASPKKSARQHIEVCPNGQLAFDFRLFNKRVGYLIRMLGALAKSHGLVDRNGAEVRDLGYEGLKGKLSDIIKDTRQWYEQLEKKNLPEL
jgi:hypothetical protein